MQIMSAMTSYAHTTAWKYLFKKGINDMLQILETKDFDKAYALMYSSFPSDEHRGYEEQKNLLADPKYTLYAIYDEDTDDKNEEKYIKAIIAVFHFDDFAFIEHFAVNPIYRNQGLGSIILNELKTALDCQICLEVELPETENAKRRIGFYERNGFYLNKYSHTQPPLSEGGNPIPLYIMTSERAVDKKEFGHIQSVLFKGVYHTDQNPK